MEIVYPTIKYQTAEVSSYLKSVRYRLISIIVIVDASAIKLESNGRISSGPKTRHIDIRYFFIKDVLEREEIDVQHCPTELMLADFFTKPLQGSKFKKMRAKIMGHIPM